MMKSFAFRSSLSGHAFDGSRGWASLVYWLHRAIPVASLVALAVTACDGPTEVQHGSVRVTVTTQGGDLDEDGYDVVIAGDRRHVGSYGSTPVLFTGVPTGTHPVVLEGVADNCTAAGGAPVMVAVTGDATSEVTIGVICEETGVRIATNTTGPEAPPNYEVRISGPALRSGIMTPTGSGLFTRLPPGSYDVTLVGIPQECDLEGSASVPVEVVNRTISDVRFDISCRMITAAIEVAISTSGTDLNPNGYRAVAGGRHVQVPINGIGVLDLLPAGIHSVRLEEVASNCTVTGGNTQAVEVRTGGTTRDTSHVAFEVACVRAWQLAYVETGWVVVAYADGSNAVRLRQGHSPSWSPDGTRLVYSTLTCDYYYYTHCSGGGLRVANLIDGTDTGLSAGENGHNPAWSPDGKTIAFIRDRKINLLPIDGEPTQATVLDSPVGAYWLSWSPDGQQLAFECGSPYDAICKINRDGTGFLTLIDDSFYNYAPAWSPDGTTIAYTKWSYGQSPDIVLTDADGTGSSRTLTTGFSPAWVPDGSRLVFAANGGLFTVRVDGSERTRITTGAHSAPAWRP